MSVKMSGLAAHHPLVSRHMALAEMSLSETDRSAEEISPAQRQRLGAWLRRKDAVLLAHYYTPSAVQELAMETGGIVADSLEMARFGKDHRAETLVVAGVRFMAETAKILSPQKSVLVLADEATCSLDLGCPIDEFSAFCDAHQDRVVVVYANTSAAVKARADWVVTSRIAVDVIEHLSDRGERILWAPDKHLGAHIQNLTGADMVLWDGACVVHEEFRAEGVRQLKQIHPEAAVLAHPESPRSVLDLADTVGSTSELVRAAKSLPNPVMIVATDRGIFHSLRREAPDREFLQAPAHGQGATCQSCGRCPWMAMNTAQRLNDMDSVGLAEIHLDPQLSERARMPLERMLRFGAG